jgi:hypothetical protein
MFNHTQDILRLTALIAGLAIIYPLQADDKKTKAESGNRARAEKQTEVLRQAKRKALTQKLAKLETQLEELSALYTPDHPKVKQAKIKIRKLREAAERDRKVQRDQLQGHTRELQNRIQHIRKAIEHLHAADLHDLAEMVGRQVRGRIHHRQHGKRPESGHEHHNHETHNRHEQDHSIHDTSKHVINQMRQAIENLEQRMRESKEIQRVVEDTHRNVDHMQREFELRIREIEQVIRHNVHEAERFVEAHSGEFEKALEQIERHVERRFSQVEERLHDLHLQFEHKDRDDEDDDEDEDLLDPNVKQ